MQQLALLRLDSSLSHMHITLKPSQKSLSKPHLVCIHHPVDFIAHVEWNLFLHHVFYPNDAFDVVQCLLVTTGQYSGLLLLFDFQSNTRVFLLELHMWIENMKYFSCPLDHNKCPAGRTHRGTCHIDAWTTRHTLGNPKVCSRCVWRWPLARFTTFCKVPVYLYVHNQYSL